MDVAKQIKLLRQALNLTRKELAHLTDLSVDTVINVEEHNIVKNRDILLKYLLERQAEAVENLEATAEAIKKIKFEEGLLFCTISLFSLFFNVTEYFILDKSETFVIGFKQNVLSRFVISNPNILSFEFNFFSL